MTEPPINDDGLDRLDHQGESDHQGEPDHHGEVGHQPSGHRAGKPRRRFAGCLPILLAFALIVAGGYFAWTKVVAPWWDEHGLFADPKDYPGPGKGDACFTVLEGDSVREVGERLAEANIVGSEDAFTDAAASEGASVFPGSYGMKKEMSAADAVEILGDMGNAGCMYDLTFLPGKRASEVVKLLVENTDFTKAQYKKALKKPADLGLPEAAAGNVEGYLWPGTYQVTPDDTPTSILKAMVNRWHQQADELGLESGAADLGYSVHELMTVASLVEAEGATLSDGDKARIARVIYNRLENPGDTAGFLGIDATVAYALGENLGVALTQEQLQVDSPYNTRTNKGLPPGPIDSPSVASLKAALRPADGDWLYYVTVNLRTGKTKFALDHDEFLVYKAEFTEYCQTSDAC